MMSATLLRDAAQALDALVQGRRPELAQVLAGTVALDALQLDPLDPDARALLDAAQGLLLLAIEGRDLDDTVRARAGELARQVRELAEGGLGLEDATAREWIIQRCISAADNEYEDWPGYCEQLLTRQQMLTALKDCEDRWPDHEFRGHNVLNQRPGSDRLRAVT